MEYLPLFRFCPAVMHRARALWPSPTHLLPMYVQRMLHACMKASGS